MSKFLRLLFLCVSLMSVSLLSACGSDDDEEGANTENANNANDDSGSGAADQTQVMLYSLGDFGNSLVSFTASNPTNTSSVEITGTQAQPDGSSEFGTDIDFRPATGGLYMAGSAGNLYTVDTVTGVATLVAALAVSANDIEGIDWDPVQDKLRVVNDQNENYLLNADGSLSSQGSDLAYAEGDINEAAEISVEGTGYTSGAEGVTTAYVSLPGSENASLGRLGGADGTPSADGGQVTTVGPYGIQVGGSSAYGFNIDDTSSIAYLLDPNLDQATPESFLHIVNLETGLATIVGEIGSDLALQGLAVLTTSTDGGNDNDSGDDGNGGDDGDDGDNGDGDGDAGGADTCLPGDPSGMLCLSQLCAIPEIGPAIVGGAGGSCGGGGDGGGGTTLDPSQLCMIPTIGPAIAEQAGVSCDGGGDGGGGGGSLCLPGDPTGQLCAEQLCAIPTLGPALVEGGGGSCGGGDGGGDSPFDPAMLCAIPQLGPAIVGGMGGACP